MNIGEAEQLHLLLFKRRMELRKRKCKDYASSEDVLKNFTHTAKMWSIVFHKEVKPIQVVLAHMLVKIGRLANLVELGRTSDCESLSDSLDDLAVYADLAYDCTIADRVGQEIKRLLPVVGVHKVS